MDESKRIQKDNQDMRRAALKLRAWMIEQGLGPGKQDK